MLSNFPLHTRKGRQSFETLNPLLPIFWIDRRNRSADQSIKSFIIQNQLIIANWNLPSQETIFHQYREAKVAHSSLPQLEYRIETVIFLLLFSLFFYLPLANRGGGEGNGHGDSSKKLGGQSSQTSSLSPLAKPLDPPRLVARLETCHYRGEFSRRRYPPVMADGVKGDQRWPRFFRSFEISTKLVQGEFRSNEKEEGKRREKMREFRRRELSREGNFFSNFLVGHRTLSGLAGLIDTWRVCCAPRFPDSTN